MEEQTDPWMALYYMRLKAMRFGTHVDTTQTTNDTTIIERMTDGTTIQLTLDPETGTWMLARFFHEQGKMITLYQQHGEYDPDEEEESGEYIP